MRHGKKFNHLSRTSAHRSAMLSNMATSLIMYKRISTTVAKAKALRKYVEPLITKAKNDSTHSRRVVFSYLKHKEPIKELFSVVVDKIADRPGGYTRILKTGTRLGDNAETCIIELVDFNEIYVKKEKQKPGRKRTRRSGAKKTEDVKNVEKTDVDEKVELDKTEVIEEKEDAEVKVEEIVEVKKEDIVEVKKEEIVEVKKEEVVEEPTKDEETDKKDEVKPEEKAEEEKIDEVTDETKTVTDDKEASKDVNDDSAEGDKKEDNDDSVKSSEDKKEE